jgi:DNA-directed RNA polymerase specialized sigma subunit
MSFDDWDDPPIPRSVAGKFRDVRRCANVLAARLGREPGRKELAKEMGLNEEDLRRIAEQADMFGEWVPDALRD